MIVKIKNLLIIPSVGLYIILDVWNSVIYLDGILAEIAKLLINSSFDILSLLLSLIVIFGVAGIMLNGLLFLNRVLDIYLTPRDASFIESYRNEFRKISDNQK